MVIWLESAISDRVPVFVQVEERFDDRRNVLDLKRRLRSKSGLLGGHGVQNSGWG